MLFRSWLTAGLTTVVLIFSFIGRSAAATSSLEPSTGESMPATEIDRTPSPFPNTDLAAAGVSPSIRPVSGSQLYRQRLAALQSGQLYTQLSRDSFHSDWMAASEQPTYEEWKALLAAEAEWVAQTQGNSHLSIVLGDSLSLWMPSVGLPDRQLWLNQGISGDTTGGILDRIWTIANTQPDRIYLLAGVNDLKNGVEDGEILENYRQILQQLREDHPQTETIVQSILPTRLSTIPNDRIRQLNHQLAAIAKQEGATFLDLSIYLTDARGELHPSLTTDGLHLNDRGYEAWQWVLQQIEAGIAMN